MKKLYSTRILILTIFLLAVGTSGVKAQLPDEFVKVDLLTGLTNATTIRFAPDGRLFILDRYGEIIIFDTASLTDVSAGTVPVFHQNEDGLLGIAFDPNFTINNYIYLYFSPEGTAEVNRVSRFTMNGNNLDLSSEIIMMEWPSSRSAKWHSAGDMGFDSQGNLYIATGDNATYGNLYAAIDENNSDFSAEKSSSNTNDLRGKILRITPQPDGTYTIPADNLFPEGTPLTRPEIYVMGARNPYRIFVDKENTDWLFWGEVGPDADVAEERGPEGRDEINLTKAAGNYGWPYFSGVDNSPYQITYANPTYYNDVANPMNVSTWNTGLTDLPPAQPALLEFFHRSYFSGPRYYYDSELTDQQRFPVEFDNRYFYYDFNTSRIWSVELDTSGNVVSNDRFAASVFPGTQDGFIDMEFGPDGKMYIMAYGIGCCPQNNEGTGKLMRIDYTGITTNAPPTVVISADKNNGSLPLTVNFSSAGTSDPNGDTPLTYSWDFGDGSPISNEENPQHIFNTLGNFNVRLTVEDGNGGLGTDNILIYSGNNITQFSFNSPPDGGLVNWEDDINIDLTATDVEDGNIPCEDLSLAPALGHIGHFHPGEDQNGCPSILTLDPASHGFEQDIFYVLNASYTDSGNLTSFGQITLHPKRKEAEFYDTENETEIIDNTDPLEGGLNAIRVDNNGYISFSGRNLQNITGVKYKVASTAGDGSIELRVGGPTGTLLTTTAVPATGGPNDWLAVTSNLTPPAGKNDLFFVFKSTSGNQDIFDLNYVEFLGSGISTDNSPPLVNDVEAEGTTKVLVQFSEYVTKETAEQLNNYAIDNGITISAAALQSDNLTVELTVSALDAATTYEITINNVQNEAGLSIVGGSYPFSNIGSIRINAGGPQVTYGAITFDADQYSNGGTLYDNVIPIEGTNEDQLYQTERFGNFSYEIPVPLSGEYDIRLHFAELFFGVGSVPGSAGSRVFNVTIEGQPVLTDFDILAETNPATALIKELNDINVEDGFASIAFVSVNENPKISAIEILPKDTFNSVPDITITSPQNGWSVNESFEVAFSVENWTILEGDTHIHWTLDGVMMEPYYSHDPIAIEGLSLGSHTIRIELYNANHTPTGIFDEVTVGVVDELVCNETPFPDSWVVHTFEANPYTAVYTFADDDLDGDGLKDIVTGGWWYKNPGSASGNWVKSDIGGAFGNVVHVYDFDEDGDLDLLGTALGIAPDNEYESAQLLWAQNDGTGNFTVFTNIPAGNTNYSEPFVAGLAGGVFSVDGPYQMAINWNGAETSGSPVQMLTPPAKDNLTTETWSLIDLSPDSSGEDMQAGDIDRDGDLDLFQGDVWLRNNGGGVFETFSTGITYGSTPDRAQLADFDRDGDLDAVVGQLSLNGTGNQKEFSWFAAPTDPTQPWVRNVLDTDIDGSLSVFAVDIDFDGDKDIVVGEWRGEQRLIVFDNDLCDSGEFNLRVIDDGALNLEHHDGARVTDIDNDGDLDVISNGWLNNLVPRIYENTTAQPDDDKPIANAGEDRTVVPSSITLNGSGSDPDGGEVTYQWSQQSGPTATLSDETATDPSTSELVEGVYVFRLTVTDDENDISFDDVTITVSNQATTVRINSGGPDFTFDGNMWSQDQYFNGGITFTTTEAIANTTNDQLYQTERYRTSGSMTYEIPVANGEHSVNLHFAEIYYGLPGDGAGGGVGSRVFSVDIEGQEQLENYDIFAAAGGPATAVIESFTGISVTDESLTITFIPVTEFPKISGIEVLTVTDPGTPTVNAGLDQTITLPTNSLVLTGSGVDPDGGVITYAWTQESGPNTATLGGSDTAELSVSDMVAGPYVFRLTVTDDEGLTAFDEISVNVLPTDGLLAIAEGSPIAGTAPLEVSFTGSNSIGDIVSYLWDFKDGNTADVADPANIFTEDGIYEVELMVTDAGGMTNTASVTVTVASQSGELQAIAEATPSNGDVPLVVTFTGDTSTGDVQSYLWDFKDGNTSTEANPTHTFTASGTYEVELTVTDSGNMTSTTSITITVSEMTNGEQMGLILEKNPTQDGIATVRVLNQPSDFVMLGINLHDSQGRILGSFKPDEVIVDGNTYQIPVYTLRDGIYFLYIAMNQGKPVSLKLLVKN